MSSPSKAISQTFAYSSGTSEEHLSSNQRYGSIVIQNGTGVTLAVACDGGSAAAGAGTNMLSCPPNSTAVFSNLLPLANADVPGTDYSLSTGWTSQSGFIGTALTYASVCPEAAATGEVTISFQD